MTAEEVLKSNEDKALSGGQFISSVAGKGKGKIKTGKKAKAIGAGIFIVGILVILIYIFGFGNFAPVALAEILEEQTNVQHADAVQSKQLVFQEALSEGKVPENTAARLKENGVLIGSIDASGNFMESANGTYLKVGDKIVSADDFYKEVNKNVELYNAFNNATYNKAAYYYDEYAQDTFNDIGVTRNSTSKDKSFEETMDEIVGEGSNITVSDISKTKTDTDDDEEYNENGSTNSKNNSTEFVKQVGEESKSSSADQATMDAASSLETADNISREQRSSKFYVGIMENISKMKAGEGSDTQINEMMNYLYRDETSQVVDTKTGEVINVTGSAMESPSLFAVLSGENLNPEDIRNYSSERVTNTIQNKLEGGTYDINNSYSGTITSTTSGLRGSIGRYVFSNEPANSEILQSVNDTMDSSLVNNSFKTIKGVAAGEMLVEGAVNVGAALANASGGTIGDEAAVTSYMKVTKDVLAMDAKADRLNRSPLDITSKNTFLGSLVRKFAIEVNKSGSFLNQFASFARVTANAAIALIPIVGADEENTSFMKPNDNCERFKSLYNAAGTTACYKNITFDPSTLESNYFKSSTFLNFVEDNIDKETNRPKENSLLANFILYNDKRQTPLGVIDGGIIDSLDSGGAGDGSGKISFISNMINIIKKLFGGGPSEEEKNIASGKAFVNSKENNDWQNYKYAQRYVSLMRAKSSLRQYDGGENAYVDIPGLGGEEDIVMAFIKEHKEDRSSIAAND